MFQPVGIRVPEEQGPVHRMDEFAVFQFEQVGQVVDLTQARIVGRKLLIVHSPVVQFRQRCFHPAVKVVDAAQECVAVLV